MLPHARAGEPARTDSTLVTSSGIDVPKPTTTTPMTSGESRALPASPTAPRTSTSPPATRPTSPARMSSAAVSIGRQVDA